jgi:myo-inositol-1-phosphate synthase
MCPKTTAGKNVGVFIAGILGNNGSTLAARLATDALTVHDQSLPSELPGSIVLHGTVKSKRRPVRDFIEVPKQIPIRGWDIRSTRPWRQTLAENKVLTSDQIDTAAPILEIATRVLPGVYKPGFAYLDQKDNVDVSIEHAPVGRPALDRLVHDIDDFSDENKLDHVVVLFSGCTEPNVDWDFSDIDSWPPSVYYAAAAYSAKTECSFTNCAAQISTSDDMMGAFDAKGRICICNNDLSTGQTKLKRLMLDFLFSCGFPPVYVASTNFLGNRDGFNLQGKAQNNSKILTKSSMLENCRAQRPGVDQCQSIAHSVNIEYVAGCGDDKLAIDEYCFGLTLGQKTSMSIRTVCKDTLLAIPLLYDLICLLPMATGTMDSRRASTLLAYYFKSTPFTNSEFLLEQLEELTEWIARYEPGVCVEYIH